MLKTKDGATLKTYAYTAFPKTRFEAGTIKLDEKDVPVRVTCVGHAKFPTYTYWMDGEQVTYAKGDLRTMEFATVKPEAPKAEEPKVEEQKPAKKK